MLPKQYGFRSPFTTYSIAEFVAITFICLLAYLLYIIVENVAGLYLGESMRSSDHGARLAHPDGIPILVIFVYYSAVAAFTEEGFYRGVLGTVLLSDQPTAVQCATYIGLSSILFAVAHAPYGLSSVVIGSLYVGIAAAGLYLWLRNLWFLIIAHFLTDLFIFVWGMQRFANSANSNNWLN